MTTDGPLPIGHLFTIPADELRWRFDTSGGPGGQHANRSATRAEVSFDLAASPSVPDHLRERMLAHLRTGAAGGVVSVTVDATRSQWRNRALARRRLTEILVGAAKTRRRRIATMPSLAARQRRLERKRRRATIKRTRREPDQGE
ncbi:MAG: alternative ribosome rescue aminoacyl-tRNA hydrolase ArfB [Actinomycetota bacterium]